MRFVLLVLLTSCNADLNVGVNVDSQVCIVGCPSLDSFAPVAAFAGESVTITGTNLDKLTKVIVGEQSADLVVSLPSKATFIMPEGSPGELPVSSPLVQANSSIQLTDSATIYRLARDYPWFSGAASDVCSGDKFYDRFGNLNNGTKDCTGSTLKLDPRGMCTLDGQKSCVTHDSFPAVNVGALNASNIKAGVIIAGVTGTYGGVGGVNCSSDGQIGCTTVANYPAIDRNAAGLAAKIRTGQTIAGVIGTYSPDFPDVANVLSNDTVNSVTGTLTLPAAANVRSSVGTFGIGGNGSTASLADCSARNQSGCVATSTYATMDLSLAGAVTDLTSSNFNTSIRTAANFEFWDSTGARYVIAGDSDLNAINIKDSVEIHGITGSVTESPANCSGANQSGCVATATYATMDKSSAGSDTGLTSGNFYTAIASASDFEFWDASGVRQTITGDADLTVGNVKSGVEIHGVTGDYPSSTYTLPSASATADLDNSTFNVQVKSATAFEYWTSDGTYQTSSGDADITAANIKSGVSIFGTSGSYAGPPPNVTGLTAVIGGVGQIDLSWDNMPVTGYLVLSREGAAVTFTPSNGVAYSLGAQGSDEVIYVGSGTSFNHASLTLSSTYHYAVYTYDGSNDYSLLATTISRTANIDCSSLTGGTWIGVPGDSDYGTSDFCVMKYEAKNVSSAPESDAAGTPWVSISQTTASAECDSLGGSYDLISSAQWMTIASNIAGVAENWSGASVGSGSLNRGHSDSSPGSLAASTDDNAPCTGTGQSCNASTWDLQRRTHKLSTGDVIWDIAGNIWEWTSYYDPNGKAEPVGNAWNEFSAVSDGSNFTKVELVPTNAVKSFWNDTWSSTEGIGQYYPGTNSSGGAMFRGGDWVAGAYAGVFAMGLHNSPSSTNIGIGFRCSAAVP